MRLFNVKLSIFQDFYEHDRPEYVILSHCWNIDEVVFKDFKDTFMTKKRAACELEARRGYSKIKRFGDQALSSGFEWVWADTICIDKKSSAELSEAINSMYHWYNDAEMCFVYLEDVIWRSKADLQLTFAEFRESRWFKRGWTLQELLAPKKIKFYDSQWMPIGTRYQFASMISLVTGIPTNLLQGTLTDSILASEASIAQKMSWIAERSTSRPEDIAYCMLGLFDVNMPLLYGEGKEKAFIRLQMEILKKSTDETIFAWKSGDDRDFSGLLAERPEYFRGAGNIKYSLLHKARSYTMTNRGLQIGGPFFELSEVHGDVDTTWMKRVKPKSMFATILNCHEDGHRKDRKLLLIAELDGTFFRLMPHLLESTTYTPEPDTSKIGAEELTIYQHWR